MCNKGEDEMDRNSFINLLSSLRENSFNWELYFFRLDKNWDGKTNPYRASEVRFRSRDHLERYAENLINMILEYRMKKIEVISEYAGDNPKISCDYIETGSKLIKDKWELFCQAVGNPESDGIGSHYNGYVLQGRRKGDGEQFAFIKLANPVISKKRGMGVLFKFDAKMECEDMTDNAFRLYLDCDIIVHGNVLYALNNRFEDLFYLEKVLKRIKDDGIEKILSTGALDDPEKFASLANSYSSQRTFLTLSSELLERLGDDSARRGIASRLGIKVAGNGKMVIQDKGRAFDLIKYLCKKLFCDDETKNLVEGSNLVMRDGT